MENTTPNTDNFLNRIEIKNFKSIKDLRLDCKRVNVFIGKPNVGKSNILEGLGLLGAEYGADRFMGGFVRYESISQLFYDKVVTEAIQVKTNQTSAILARPAVFIGEHPDFTYEYYKGHADGVDLIASNNDLQNSDKFRDLNYLRNNPWHFNLTDEGKVSGLAGQGTYINKHKPGSVKKYDFNGTTKFVEGSFTFLMPPHGRNLYSVVNQNLGLWDEFAKLFEDQHLKFVLLDSEQTFVLNKEIGVRIKQFPFFSIADTFRRFMFYITAIESNKNSVIIFEEPEVHSFPPYTQDIAYRMIYSEENQFFVSTHSPYLLQTLVSNLKDDQLNVFVTYYENYETKVKALTAEELSFVQEYSTDVFFNLDRFVPNAQSANPA